MLKTKIKEKMKQALCRLPYIGPRLRAFETHHLDYPPGHYYSPIVAKEEIRQNLDRLFGPKPKEIEGIDLNESAQLSLLQDIAVFYRDMPFVEQPDGKHRYYFDNNFYVYSDAIMLHCLLRHLRPQRIIEAGSGFSSAVMLDTNEFFFDRSISLAFIEPNPQRLESLLRANDKEHCEIIPKRLQDVPLSFFDRLETGDILFIDSTHVAKTGSDVLYALFEILPRLKKGVFIHFHDIHYPFEYPLEWALHWNGFGWNETYFLRAYLTHNPNYSIRLFNTFLHRYHADWFEKHMPLCLTHKATTAASIWIETV